MTNFLALLDSFPSRQVAVVGDYLLDQYLLGTTARVSREAPIVVVDYQDTLYHPGGAANASQNVTAVGGRALAVGVLGRDREADVLLDLLVREGVDTRGIARDANATTSTKLRILAGEMNAQKQQVARVDRSHRVQASASLAGELAAALDTALAAADALLLADYGLGVLTPALIERAISGARARSLPVIVDSRHRMSEFRGATVAVPNEVEAMEALGIREESALLDAATMCKRVAAVGLGGLIVTRGSQGMIVCDERGTFTSVGIAGKSEATDVTGAGDTVSALVALALASGASLADAARMATFGASVVVMKRGTATASREEVREVILRDRHAEEDAA